MMRIDTALITIFISAAERMMMSYLAMYMNHDQTNLNLSRDLLECYYYISINLMIDNLFSDFFQHNDIIYHRFST